MHSDKQTLFDEKERTLSGPSDYSADSYTYYNESTRADINNVRKQLELWFGIYPESEKEELKQKFKVAFYPTFYELYIYALFTKLGYSLEIHPDIPGTTKHPDYLARKDEELFYIEVKHMTMLTRNELSLENRKNVLLDAINKVDASNFVLKLEEITFKDSSQPSGKVIAKFFNDEISSHNPDLYTELLITSGFEAMPEVQYEDEKVRIKVILIPKSPMYRGTNSGSIGIHPLVTQIGNDSENIVGSLETKATRYGNLNAPYIICLNKQSVALDIMEVQQALYGSLQNSWSENPNNRNEKLKFTGNGFFGSKQNPKFTRVSGVYVTNANTANLATTANHVFRHNPQAQYPINFHINKPIKDILDVHENFPYN